MKSHQLRLFREGEGGLRLCIRLNDLLYLLMIMISIKMKQNRLIFPQLNIQWEKHLQQGDFDNKDIKQQIILSKTMNSLLRSYHSSQLFDDQNLRKISTFVDQLKDSSLSYLEFIRALYQMSITSEQIESVLVWKYTNNYSFVNQSWSKILSINEIVYDYYLLKQYQHSNLKTIQSFLSRKENQKKMTIKLRSEEEMKKRISTLHYELNSLSDKIGRAQQESISLSAQKQYESRKRQLHILKRVERSMKSLPASKRRQYFQTIQRGQVALVGFEKNPSSLNLKETNCVMDQKSQNSGLQMGLKLMQELQRIFLEYASKNTTSFLTESDKGVSQRQMMKYKSFLLFVKDSQIDRHLKFQQRLNIFNKYSKCKKQFQFTDFVKTLQQICKLICSKKEIAFNIKNYRGFLYLCLEKIQEKRPTIFRRLKLKNYKFDSLKIHTGHYRQSMQQRLKSSAETREQRKVSIIDRLKLLKVQSPNIRQKCISLKKTTESSDNQKRRRLVRSLVPSYSDKIRLTLQYQNQSRKDSGSPLSQSSPVKGKYSTRLIESQLSNKSPKKDSYQEQLVKIIDFSEQDIFLQKMLFQSRRKHLKCN